MESLSKETEDPKKNQMAIVRLKNMIAKIKNLQLRGQRKQSVNVKIETEVVQRRKKRAEENEQTFHQR